MNVRWKIYTQKNIMRVYEVLIKLFQTDDHIREKLNLSPDKIQKLKSGKSPVWLDIELVKKYKVNPLYLAGIQDKMFLPWKQGDSFETYFF
jgi:hypothetical protein